MAGSKNTGKSVFFTQEDLELFEKGIHYSIYEKLGAHKTKDKGVSGVYFAVWAPNAAYVNVIGSFNDWDMYTHNMERLGPGGIFALFVPGAQENDCYKYVITTKDDQKLFKADPYANYAQIRPGNASRVTDLTGYKWSDSAWMNAKKTKDCFREPMAIYECHIGSWRRHEPKSQLPEEDYLEYYNYREFADQMVDYLKEMKYTHVELMGIAEHPFDGSWGYQVTGYFAPTSRYGTPADFMYLVDTLHQNGVGVILDWVPAHFPKDDFGLAEFDGTCLYEHPDSRRGEHPDWGTKIFDYGRNEVKNFLIANAFYWVREYHIDGLRVDAVASMLYLDYGKSHGQWLPNKYGTNKNLEAIEFFRHLNSIMGKQEPGTIMIAEESTAWPKVTRPAEEDGLGFTFKWNMGWMHDFCEYMKLDPLYRKGNHYKMTFGMSYNEAEKYILPISHDEVVHLKCSMLNKMPGYRIDKFANLRTGYAYMFTHSGKKLLFMGQDFGQEAEWCEKKSLDWECLQDELHAGLQLYMKNLLQIYNRYPSLYEIDDSWAGFQWMDADDAANSVYSYVRRAKNGENNILAVLNMTPVFRQNYKVAAPDKTTYKLILNSDEKRFGGQGTEIPSEIKATVETYKKQKCTISFDLPAYGSAIFLF